MKQHDLISTGQDFAEASSSSRRDGWTPAARRLFLEVLSETGRVGVACRYCGLSRASAYALRHRDPLFDAGWRAACELARPVLADELQEQAVDGFEERIVRNGETVATRIRHDSRLSIAVLNRLDKLHDKAVAERAPHLRLAYNWDEWLDHVGKDDAEGARALLAGDGANSPQDCQLRQLPLADFPTGRDDASALSGELWQEDGEWWTDFPPPEGFEGEEHGCWGDLRYKRQCSEEESRLIELDEQAERDELLVAAAAERDAYFAGLKAVLGQAP